MNWSPVSTVSSGENRDNLKVTLENIKEASKNAEMALLSIENAARKIDRGEGTIGKLVNDDSMYNNIDSAAKGISDYTSRIEKMKTVVGFRSEYMFPKPRATLPSNSNRGSINITFWK